MTFGIGGELLRVRLLLEELLDVRHLVEILAQILEQARELRGVGGEECVEADVRDLARSQGGVLLLGPGVLADLLPFDLAVAVDLEVLGPLHVGDLVRGRPLHDQDAHDRLAVGGRGRLLVAATCSQRTQQGDGARDGARLQYGSSSHRLSFDMMMFERARPVCEVDAYRISLGRYFVNVLNIYETSTLFRYVSAPFLARRRKTADSVDVQLAVEPVERDTGVHNVIIITFIQQAIAAAGLVAQCGDHRIGHRFRRDRQRKPRPRGNGRQAP